MITRVVAYVFILAATMWAAEAFFHDTYAANLGLFSLFVVVFELLWDRARCDRRRLWWYLACVAGIGLAGAVLVWESVRAQPADAVVAAMHKKVGHLLNEAPSLAVATDGGGTIEAVSERLLEATGYSKGELIGRPVRTLFPDEDHSGLTGKGWGSYKRVGVRLLLKDGRAVTVTKYVFGVRYSEGGAPDFQFISLMFEEK